MLQALATFFSTLATTGSASSGTLLSTGSGDLTGVLGSLAAGSA